MSNYASIRELYHNSSIDIDNIINPNIFLNMYFSTPLQKDLQQILINQTQTAVSFIGDYVPKVEDIGVISRAINQAINMVFSKYQKSLDLLNNVLLSLNTKDGLQRTLEIDKKHDGSNNTNTTQTSNSTNDSKSYNTLSTNNFDTSNYVNVNGVTVNDNIAINQMHNDNTNANINTTNTNKSDNTFTNTETDKHIETSYKDLVEVYASLLAEFNTNYINDLEVELFKSVVYIQGVN